MQQHLEGEASCVRAAPCTLLPSHCLPCVWRAEAGLADAACRLAGFLCLDSCSPAQADSFKLLFDQQPNSKVRERL